jgi:CheY-like chemotaxis protein
LGYRVIAAGDGPQALDLARQASRIDLLLTDVMLPKGMNGRQLGEALTRERPGLRVLYVSGYSEEIIQHRGTIEPGVQLITKPFTKAQLAAGIRAALGTRPPADSVSR